MCRFRPRERERAPNRTRFGALAVGRYQPSKLLEPSISVSVIVCSVLFEPLSMTSVIPTLVQLSALTGAVTGATTLPTRPPAPTRLSPPVASVSTSAPSWADWQSLPRLSVSSLEYWTFDGAWWCESPVANANGVSATTPAAATATMIPVFFSTTSPRMLLVLRVGERIERPGAPGGRRDRGPRR